MQNSLCIAALCALIVSFLATPAEAIRVQHNGSDVFVDDWESYVGFRPLPTPNPQAGAIGDWELYSTSGALGETLWVETSTSGDPVAVQGSNFLLVTGYEQGFSVVGEGWLDIGDRTSGTLRVEMSLFDRIGSRDLGSFLRWQDGTPSEAEGGWPSAIRSNDGNVEHGTVDGNGWVDTGLDLRTDAWNAVIYEFNISTGLASITVNGNTVNGLPGIGGQTVGNLVFRGDLDSTMGVDALVPEADNLFFKEDQSDNWNVIQNWGSVDPNRIPVAPNGNTKTALLGNVITAPRTLTTDVPVTVKGIEFDNANAYTIDGANSLTLQSNTGTATIDVTQGDHAINAPVVFDSNTTITETGGDLHFGGDITVNSGVTVTKGSLEMGSGQTLSGAGTFNAVYRGVDSATISSSGGTLTVGSSTAVNGFHTEGNINANGNTVALQDLNDAVLDGSVLADLGSGGTLAAQNGLTLDFGGNIAGFGTVNTPDNVATPLINNGHISGNDPNQQITLTGYVKGVGTCDNCNITGTDAPGFSTAAVNRGSVSYNGTLEIEIGGTTPGSGFDQLNHILGAGVADLGGTLDLQLTGGFTPSMGDTFEIITTIGGVVDGFLNVANGATLGTAGGEGTFVVNYGAGSAFDPDSVVLSGFVLSSAAPTDPDGNGFVDGRDLLILQRDNPALIPAWRVDYGGPPSSVGTGAGLAAVPEPSSILLLVAGCILALSRRGNRI